MNQWLHYLKNVTFIPNFRSGGESKPTRVYSLNHELMETHLAKPTILILLQCFLKKKKKLEKA